MAMRQPPARIYANGREYLLEHSGDGRFVVTNWSRDEDESAPDPTKWKRESSDQSSAPAPQPAQTYAAVPTATAANPDTGGRWSAYGGQPEPYNQTQVAAASTGGGVEFGIPSVTTPTTTSIEPWTNPLGLEEPPAAGKGKNLTPLAIPGTTAENAPGATKPTPPGISPLKNPETPSSAGVASQAAESAQPAANEYNASEGLPWIQGLQTVAGGMMTPITGTGAPAAATPAPTYNPAEGLAWVQGLQNWLAKQFAPQAAAAAAPTLMPATGAPNAMTPVTAVPASNVSGVQAPVTPVPWGGQNMSVMPTPQQPAITLSGTPSGQLAAALAGPAHQGLMQAGDVVQEEVGAALDEATRNVGQNLSAFADEWAPSNLVEDPQLVMNPQPGPVGAGPAILGTLGATLLGGGINAWRNQPQRMNRGLGPTAEQLARQSAATPYPGPPPMGPPTGTQGGNTGRYRPGAPQTPAQGGNTQPYQQPNMLERTANMLGDAGRRLTRTVPEDDSRQPMERGRPLQMYTPAQVRERVSTLTDTEVAPPIPSLTRLDRPAASANPNNLPGLQVIPMPIPSSEDVLQRPTTGQHTGRTQYWDNVTRTWRTSPDIPPIQATPYLQTLQEQGLLSADDEFLRAQGLR